MSTEALADVATAPEIVTGYPLSPPQARLWRLLAAGGEPGFGSVAQLTLDLHGPVDENAVRAALATLVERHEILRTVLRAVPGLTEPVQVVLPPDFAFAARDLRDLEDWPRIAAEEAEAQRRTAADMAGEPALRALFVSGGEEDHRLILTLPALCADAGSARVLATELATVFAGEEVPLEERLQYAQAGEWLNQTLTGEDGEPARAFWRRQGAPAAEAGLPFQTEPPAAAAWRSESVPLDLAGGLACRIVEAGGDALPAFLFAAFRVVLARSAGERAWEGTVGWIADGRKYAELDVVPGLFARCLPIRDALALDSPFSGVVMATAQALAEAQEWLEGFAFGDAAVPAVLTAGCELVELPEESLAAGPVRIRVQGAESTVDCFRLHLRLVRQGASLGGELRFDPEAFDRGAARRIAERFETLLAAAVAAPDRAVAELALIGPQELRWLTVDLNATAASWPEHASLHGLILAQAAHTPDRPALIAGETTWTFGELEARSAAVAGLLRRRGVGPESVVGLLAEPSPELVAAILGVLRAGAAYLPLDPSHPAERLAFTLTDAGACLLLAEARCQALPGTAVPVLFDAEWKAPRVDDGPAGAPELPAVSPDHLAYVLYTSGSTGRPKGTLVPHRGVVNYLSWAVVAYELHEGAGAPLHSPLAFDLTVTSLFGPLLAGRPVVLPAGVGSGMAQGGPAAGVETLAALMRATPEPYGLIKLTPGHLRLLSRQLSPEETARAARCLVLGGEALAEADLAVWRAAAPLTRMVNEYGPTETVVGCCIYEAGDDEQGAVPIGHPIANARIQLLGSDLRPVPSGLAGEVYVGGPGVARGYLGRPHLTAERFVPDPFPPTPGERLYRTGDLARRRSDGTLEYLGRIDHQVKVRGFRVEPGEIEAVIAAHPRIAEAAVALRDDRLVAYVVPRDAMPGVAELQEHAANSLPSYMIPAAFVQLDRLPLTANGKVDRSALPDLAALPAQAGTGAAPRTVEEEILAGVWSRVLGVERVGIDDDFFALGGDSIRSIPVVSLAQARGLRFSIDQLFRHRTIRRLAGDLRAAETSAAPPASAAFELLSEADRRAFSRLPRIEDAYPLSRLQAGMIYHLQASPESGVYHDIFSYRIRAPLDVEVLRRAVVDLIGRHPALRTRFALTGYSEPLQLVESDGVVPFAVHDLRHLRPEELVGLPATYIAEERRRGFDPQQLPLFRIAVHRLDDDVFQFSFSFHHAILDGWSDAAMLIELAVSYGALLRGEESPFAPPTTRHRDFVQLERETLADPAATAFWRERLRERPSGALPRRRDEGDEIHDPLPVWYTVPVSPEMSDGFERLARRAAVPVKHVLLAAHLRALAALTGEVDVLTCMTTNGRPEAEDGERVLGLFLNSMPLRLTLRRGESWLALIQRAFESEREALPFRRFPMVEIQAWYGGQRLSDSSFYFTHYHIVGNLDRVPELAVEGIEFHEATSFPLVANFHVDAFTERVRIELTVDGTLFEPDEVARLGEVYTAVLGHLVEAPEAPYDTLCPLPEADLRQALASWGASACATPAPLLHGRFLKQARATPEAVAVSFEGGAWTYDDLERASRRAAERLRRLGAGPETVVAVALERSPELLAALLGVLRAGAAYLPLDPATPRERLAWILGDAGARWVLTSPNRDLPSGVTRLTPEDLLAAPETPAPPATLPDADVAPENLAYIIYTSGSTGRPKGVQIPHGGLAHYLDWALRSYPVAGSALLHTSVAFDLAVTTLFAPLCAGGRVVLAPEASPGSDPAGTLAAALRAEQAAAGRGFTLLKLTPTHLRLLGGLPEAAGAAEVLVVGGEALQAEDLAAWRVAAPRTLVVNEYGPTEAVVGCAVYSVAAGDLESGPVPIGRPIDGVRLRLLDGLGQPVPPGVPGELLVGGAGLARGYLARPDLTAERFVPDPWAGEPGARLYRTGDLVRSRPDANLEYLGRRDQQVKVRGYRIEPGEVEAALTSYPGIRQAAVLAHSQDGDTRLVAYLVPAGAMPALEALRSFLAERLPDAMIPADYVPLAELPLAPSGKLDRAALPAPGSARIARATPYEPPRTTEEEVLAGIWARALAGGAPVGLDDDYFTLGGDSIRSIQVVAQGRERGLDFTLDDLFRHRTVRRLAEALAARQPAPPEPALPPFGLLEAADRALLPAGLEDAFPLSRLQAGMLYHREVHAESAIYHDTFSFHLRAPFDAAAVRGAVVRLIARHPALRTRFDLASFSEPLQLVEREGTVHLAIDDLSHLDPEAQEQAIADWRDAEHGRGFDPSRLPLIRYQVHLRSRESFQFSFGFHHAIMDGWSDATMLTELALSYQALLLGEEPPLTPPAARYRDFVALERQVLASPDQRGYWLRLLEGAEPARPPVETPPDRGGERRGGARGILRTAVPIDERLSDALQAAARAAAVPVKSVLLAAHVRVLAALAATDDVLTTLAVAGRLEHADGERVLGLFLNSAPLRAVLPGGSWLALVRGCFESEREALPFRRFPISETQRLLGWTAVPPTTFYFTHYHVFRQLERAPDVAVLDVSGYEETSFLLVAMCGMNAWSGRLTLELIADRTQVAPGQLEAWSGLYLAALESLAGAPDAPYDGVPLLSAADLAQVLQAWNPPVPHLRPGTVHQLVGEQARRRPEAEAVAWDGGHLTYGRLWEESSRLAAWLEARGVGPTTWWPCSSSARPRPWWLCWPSCRPAPPISPSIRPIRRRARPR